MTSVYFNSTASSGYVVTTDTLTLGPNAYIGGAGIEAAAQAFIDNRGTVHGSSGTGIDLEAGSSTIFNRAGASIIGATDGIYGSGAGIGIINYGSIAGATTGHVYGIDLATGGAVYNHSGGHIDGSTDAIRVRGGTGTVTNAGSIHSNSYYAVDLQAGGSVTNVSTGTITSPSNEGVHISGGAGAISNSGSIYGGIYGVAMVAGGKITNEASAQVTGEVAAKIGGIAGTIINYGTLAGSAATPHTGILNGTGAVLFSGGDVTNASGGLISGKSDGIVLFAAGTVTNQAGAEIVGSLNLGIYFTGGNGTVINAGTISSGNDAIQFVGSYSNRVILDAGSTIQGKVVGGSGTNVLELATGSGEGTISSLGTSFTNFGTILVDTGASWHLAGTNSIASGGTLIDRGTLTIGSSASLVNDGTIKVNGGVLIDNSALGGAGTIDITNGGTAELLGAASGATIDFMDASEVQLSDPTGVTVRDFAAGDVIDLIGVSYAPGDTVSYDAGLNAFVVEDSGGDTLATIGAANFTLASGYELALQPDGNGTDILEQPVPCYVRGTRLRTSSGEVAVEDLCVGDLLLTRSGDVRPVLWIGRATRQAARLAAGELPVRIRRGALGDNVPCRDLIVSPGHCLYLDGGLVPARFLVNDVSILRETALDTIEYFHVELPAHDIVLAEGTEAESYLDTGNRSAFGCRDHADRPRENAERYAPLLTSGPRLMALRQAIAARLGQFGMVFTDEPDLRLVVDGCAVQAEVVGAGVHHFRLPARADSVRIVSRTGVPGELVPRSRDGRRLGVALSKIVLRAPGVVLEIDHTAPILEDGFYRSEAKFRWTDGDALLPIAGLAPFGGDITVELHVAITMRYLVEGRSSNARAA